MPKVSIIIPVFNVEAYLRQCLDSVVNQTLHDIEIICVDDGSMDGSAAILQEYASKDSRVKVLLHEHTNAGAARNAGMSVATGEYLGFIDSDDWCETTLFEKAYNKAKSDDADVVSWRYVQYDVRLQKKGAPRVFPRKVLSLPMPFGPEDLGENIFAPITYAPWGRLVRRAFAVSEGLRFQEIVRTNDVFFCCMVLALAKRQTLVDEVLYTYRVGTGANLQASNASSPTSVFVAWQAVADELERRGLHKHMRSALISASANSLFYTLNIMPSSVSWCDFHGRLRKLYETDAFYSSITVGEIDNPQTAAYFRILKETDEPLEFLVRQENYYRERLATEYWSRVSAQKANRELQAREACLNREHGVLSRQIASLAAEKAKSDAEVARLGDEKALAEGSRDKLQRENESLSREVVLLNEACAELKEKLAWAHAARDEMERSISFRLGRAITWLPRCIQSGMWRVNR